MKYLIIADSKNINYLDILKDFDLKEFAIIIAKNQLPETQHKKYTEMLGKLITIDNWANKISIWNTALQLLDNNHITEIAALNEEELLLAGALREHFHIDGMNYQQTMCFRDKVKMKQTAFANGIEVPFFAAVDNFLDIHNFIDKYGYNVILKPRASHSSQGLYFIRSQADVDKIISEKSEHEFSGMIIENIINGPMFQVDGLIKNGELVLSWPSVSINQWSDINNGLIVGRHFMEPGNNLLESLQEYTKKAIKAFPTLQNGVFQIEFFHDTQNNKFIFCEIAARVCGTRGREAWMQSFNIDLVKESILQQLHLPSDNSNYLKTPKNLAGYFLLPIRQKPLPEKMPLDVLEYFVPKKQTTYGGLVFFAAKNQADCLQIFEQINNWYAQLN